MPSYVVCLILKRLNCSRSKILYGGQRRINYRRGKTTLREKFQAGRFVLSRHAKVQISHVNLVYRDIL